MNPEDRYSGRKTHSSEKGYIVLALLVVVAIAVFVFSDIRSSDRGEGPRQLNADPSAGTPSMSEPAL